MHTYAIVHTKYDPLKSHSDNTTFFTRLYTCVRNVCARAYVCMRIYTCTPWRTPRNTTHTDDSFFPRNDASPTIFHHFSQRKRKKEREEKIRRACTRFHTLSFSSKPSKFSSRSTGEHSSPHPPRDIARNTLLQRSRERDEMIGYDDDDDARLAPISHGGKSDRSSRNIGSSRSDDDRSPVPFPPIQSGSGAVYEEENHSVSNVPLRN